MRAFVAVDLDGCLPARTLVTRMSEPDVVGGRTCQVIGEDRIDVAADARCPRIIDSEGGEDLVSIGCHGAIEDGVDVPNGRRCKPGPDGTARVGHVDVVEVLVLRKIASHRILFWVCGDPLDVDLARLRIDLDITRDRVAERVCFGEGVVAEHV